VRCDGGWRQAKLTCADSDYFGTVSIVRHGDGPQGMVVDPVADSTEVLLSGVALMDL